MKELPLWGNSNPPPGIQAILSNKTSVERIAASVDAFEEMVLELQRNIHTSVKDEHMVGATIALGQVAAMLRFYKPKPVSPPKTPPK